KHVRFRVFLRGREVSEPQAGFDVLNKVASMLEDVANIEKDFKVDGRYVNMLATPKK
ncbi:MAG: translation initiation factor IF-3, partial [Helicobacter sp.]|nr:translation initiation factor IF-3 [Helicobacter sp.]